ncbi:MAG: ComEC/Rec2 family competence protein [Patescibacteria group bacterium]
MKGNILLVLIFGFIAGVGVRSFFNLFWSAAIFALLLSFLALVLFFLTSRKKFFLAAALALAAFSLGVWRYEIKDQKAASSILAPRINSEVALRGVIVDEPDERENNTRLIFLADGLRQNGQWQDINRGKILVYTERYPEFKYGDFLEIKGILKEPENFSDDFDWRAYLTKDDIFLLMYYPKIEKQEEGAGSFVKQKLFALKNNYIAGISRVLPEPYASFLGGLTIGARKSIPEDLQNDFRKTGVIHLVVLSGYNVTIIAENIGRALAFLPLPHFVGIILSVLAIFLFTIMTGASATIVRASIMAILVLLARSTGRVYEVTIALLVAGFAMIMHNPKILRFDSSFQLSFAATLGLIYLAPRLEKHLGFLPKSFGLRGYAAATASAQLAVAPLILYSMGAISLVALPVNILILMFVPATMLFGFLTWLAGLLHYAASLPFAWISWLLLNYELWVVNIFARLSWAEWLAPNFSAFSAILIYGLLGWLVFKPKSLSIFWQKKEIIPPLWSKEADEFEIEEIK